MVTIQTGTTLTAGNKYQITIDFISVLNDELRGFYRYNNRLINILNIILYYIFYRSSYMENGVRK